MGGKPFSSEAFLKDGMHVKGFIDRTPTTERRQKGLVRCRAMALPLGNRAELYGVLARSFLVALIKADLKRGSPGQLRNCTKEWPSFSHTTLSHSFALPPSERTLT